MPKKLDLTNQRFGKLIALAPTRKNGRTAWRCKCDCGNEIDVFTFCLRNGNTSSCGCNQTNQVKDELNKRYGKLTVIDYVGINNHHAEWKCRCDCGNVIIAKGDLLRNGSVTSCGCNKIIDETNNKYGKLSVISMAYIDKHCAFWNCKCDCGNEIIVAGNHLRSGHTRSCGCVKSFGETRINEILTENNINYTTQYTVFINDAYYRFDYAIFDEQNNLLKLIEFDGEQHFPNNNASNFYDYEATHCRDIIKNEYCEKHQIPLIRIPYWERDNLTLDLILSNKYLIIK